MTTNLWDRTDITVFIAAFANPGELGEFFRELQKLCPKATRRGCEWGEPPSFNSGASIMCLGWSSEPLWSLSWGGLDEGDKLWGHEEFLDHVGYNSR